MNKGYHAENRVVSAASATYSYDGKSLRVQKVSGGTTTVYIFSGTKAIAEYAGGAAPGSPAVEYVYGPGGELLATIQGGTPTYHLRDHLSVRVSTNPTGSKIGEQGHYPYGETWYASGTTTKWQFTSYERDAESGNDYAMARFYINRFGRFYSPDPVSGSPANPQTLNLFTYVVDDPIDYTDPDGTLALQTGGGCRADPGGIPPFFPGGGFPWPIWWPGGGAGVGPTPPLFPEGEGNAFLPGWIDRAKEWLRRQISVTTLDCSCTFVVSYPLPLNDKFCRYRCTCTNAPNVIGLYGAALSSIRRECRLPVFQWFCPGGLNTKTVVLIIRGFPLPSPAFAYNCRP